MSKAYDYDFIMILLYLEARGVSMDMFENMIAELDRRLSRFPRSVLSGDHFHYEYQRYGYPDEKAGTYSCGFAVSVDAMCLEADAADHLMCIMAVCRERNLTLESLTVIKSGSEKVEFSKEKLEAIRDLDVRNLGTPTAK